MSSKGRISQDALQRINNINLCYGADFDDFPTIVQIRAHEIVSQMVSMCERKIQEKRRLWVPTLFRKTKAELVMSAYEKSALINVFFLRQGNKMKAGMEFENTAGHLIFRATFEIETWGHLSRISLEGKP